MSDAHTLLSALHTDAALDPWTALLARAGRSWLETGLATGEFLDGIHVNEGDASAAARRLAADTGGAWPRRYTNGAWALLADRHPDGGLFLRLQGPADGMLQLGEASWPLVRRQWHRVPVEGLPSTVVVRLADGTRITLEVE